MDTFILGVKKRVVSGAPCPCPARQPRMCRTQPRCRTRARGPGRDRPESPRQSWRGPTCRSNRQYLSHTVLSLEKKRTIRRPAWHDRALQQRHQEVGRYVTSLRRVVGRCRTSCPATSHETHKRLSDTGVGTKLKEIEEGDLPANGTDNQTREGDNPKKDDCAAPPLALRMLKVKAFFATLPPSHGHRSRKKPARTRGRSPEHEQDRSVIHAECPCLAEFRPCECWQRSSPPQRPRKPTMSQPSRRRWRQRRGLLRCGAYLTFLLLP